MDINENIDVADEYENQSIKNTANINIIKTRLVNMVLLKK